MLAAQALVHIGRCYEKLGKGEAQKAYEQVVQEYALLPGPRHSGQLTDADTAGGQRGTE